MYNYPSFNKSVGFLQAPEATIEETKNCPKNPNGERASLNWEWYCPPEDSLPVNFCSDTSLHGLQYLGQRKRHICERLFWLAAVIVAIGTAGYLIWGIYADNRDMPIVTIFSPVEQTIDKIPFPAVTICNVNNIQKSKFNAVLKEARLAKFKTMTEAHQIYAKLLDMYYICKSGQTFTDKFYHGLTGFLEDALLFNNQTHEFENFVNPKKTLAENSQSCKEMIMYCIWLGEIRNCSNFFQVVETDYGYCCTFNMIPVSLLVRNDSRDDPIRIKEWKEVDLNYDNLLFTDETANRKYPFRQQYPGREAGLSVFLDPDLDEYHCTNTDSLGFVVGLNVPLDFPRIKDNGISIPNGSEVLISIRPHVTMTDHSVNKFSLEKRQCYFGKEYTLPHYTKYTTSNCLDECIANTTKEKCGCVRYYMPHALDGTRKDKFCRPPQYTCVEDVRTQIYQAGLGKACGVCLPTCTEIEYDPVVTQLMIQDKKVERLFNTSFLSKLGQHLFKKGSNLHHPSIVHIYFGVDSTHPKLRTESSSYTELISNAGGILGLCLGFSMLSLLEIAYYATLRLGCNWYRERTLEKMQKENVIILNYDDATSTKFQKMSNKKSSNWLPGGISVSNVQQKQTGYNTLFEKWAE